MKHEPKKSGGMHLARGLHLRNSLVTAVLGTDYATPRAKKPEKVKTRPPSKGPDELVLEVRRLREQVGFSISQIREHARHLGFELTAERVHQLCEYTTRSHLVPAANAAPYLERKPT